MNYARRIENLRKKMELSGVDGAFIANDASWEYLTGLPRCGHDNTRQRQNSMEFACLLVTPKKVTAFAPRLSALGYSGRMEDFPQVDELIIYPDPDIYGERFDNEVTAQGLDGKTLGVTRDVSSMLTLRLIDKHSASVKDISADMDALRAIKDEDEIELMRYASKVADNIYYDVLPMLKVGTPIRDIEHEIERLLETYDCSYTSFPAEVLNYGPKAGNRIGEPYAYIEADHVIAFDYGVVYKGYCSDFGRTVFLREPAPELRRAHELVMKAQQAALDSAVIGKSKCSELNSVCHGIMEEAGMGEFFIHRMGHCIGKDVHERPFMAEGEDTVLQRGMCFTDEPSLFLAGKGLVRVEDVVLTKEDGFEYLNKITKELVGYWNRGDCSMGEVLLEVKNLKTQFATEHGIAPAVDGLSFTLEKGKVLGIVGESGSGKSVTSLSIMRLLQEPAGRIADGEILFGGKDLTKLSEKEMQDIRGAHISMIFQEPMTALNPVYTVGDQIAEVFIVRQKMKKKEARKKAVEMLRMVGIPSPETRAGNYPHQLSGGMRQRVVIAIALACNPELLIADEPTTALDVTIQAQILELMRNLKEELGTSMIMITHDLGIIYETADDVLVMYCGQAVESGSMKAVFDKMLHPYTEGLMNSIPKLSDDKEELDTIEGMVPSLYDLPKGCRFNPRCPYAKKVCRECEPELTEVESGHFSRCHRYTDLWKE